jgi:transcriptional regulator with XRE-family HTH domain
MTALSQLLADANSGGLSARAIARAAREQGHTLNHDTAARYLRGDHGRPDEATLTAFAEVLDISLASLRAAADLPTELTTPYEPPPEASRLSRRQRRAVDEVIRAMLNPAAAALPDGLPDEQPAGVGPRLTPMPTAHAAPASEGAQAAQAARHGESEPPAD